jgi:protein tyrosine/serine phosphatase
VGSIGLFALGVACAVEGRGLPEQEGINNFGKVNEMLYRGSQPDAAGIENLKRLGIKTIINLRMTNDVWQSEAALAQARGILYTNMPLQGLGRPSDEQIRKILGLIESLPGPVFVHCQFGCDRTGTIIACYRIQHDQWSNDKALDEAKRYGLSPLERGMRAYILEFGEKK